MTESKMFASVSSDGSATMGSLQNGFRINTDGTYEVFAFHHENNLEQFQAIVGGLIEPINLSNLGMTLWGNEEARLIDCDPNPIASAIVAYSYKPAKTIPILGNVFLTHLDTDSEGNTLGLSEDTIQQLIALMKENSNE